MSILSTSSKLVRVGDSYSAGEGISIENNVISVTGDYGHAYYPGENISISDDNVISSKDWSSDIDTAVQNVSAETTAWVDSQNYLTDAAMSDYALITDVETTSGLLKMDIDTVSASITGKMDSTAFNDWQNGQYSNDIAGLSNDIGTVSGAVDAISGAVSSLDIPTRQDIENASGYAYSQSTAWSDSQGYLKEHQDISYLATKDEVSAYTLTTTLEQVSGDIVSKIPSIEGLATKSEVDTVSSFLSGAIDYVSANAGDEFPASANDAITAYQTYSGTYLTAHQSLDGYLTKTSADTLYQPIGSYASQTDLEQVSGDLKDDIDYISGVAITAHQDISNKLDTTAFSTVSGTFLTAVDLSNYYTKSETSGAAELANAFSNIPAGDADVNAYVQNNSATINDVNSTVQTNSAQWGEGTSVETVPVAVISPLVTGFSGDSAYLGIESTALNLSSYVPVSAIGVNSYGYVSWISGRNISAYFSVAANYAYTANTAYKDRNNNEITSYYQPKLTITGDAGTITAINGSAVGASIPEGWELVAGAGIEIVDDAENNQTTISVTAAGGNPEVESYVQSNSASIDDAVSTYQSNSGSYITQETDWTNTITAASSYAYSEAVAQIPAPFDPTYISGVIDNKLDTTAFSDVSGSFLTAVNIPESANWNEATTTVQTNSSNWDNVTNKLDTTSFSDVSSTFLTAVDLTPYQTIEGMTAYQPAGSYATTNELEQVSGDITALIPSTAGLASESYVQSNSAVLTGMIDGKQDTLTFGYDEQDRINSINNSALAGGGDVPEDVMVETNLEYNAIGEISGYGNSAIAQYGAEKQWLVHDDTLCHLSNSAQYALGVNLSAVSAELSRMFKLDETILVDNLPVSSTGFTLSEKASNFEILKIYGTYGNFTMLQGRDDRLSWTCDFTNTANIRLNRCYTVSSNDGIHWNEVNVYGFNQTAFNGSLYLNGGTDWWLETLKIIGIGRKS